jgi:hypothetical protein
VGILLGVSAGGAGGSRDCGRTRVPARPGHSHPPTPIAPPGCGARSGSSIRSTTSGIKRQAGPGNMLTLAPTASSPSRVVGECIRRLRAFAPFLRRPSRRCTTASTRGRGWLPTGSGRAGHPRRVRRRPPRPVSEGISALVEAAAPRARPDIRSSCRPGPTEPDAALAHRLRLTTLPFSRLPPRRARVCSVPDVFTLASVQRAVHRLVEAMASEARSHDRRRPEVVREGRCNRRPQRDAVRCPRIGSAGGGPGAHGAVRGEARSWPRTTSGARRADGAVHEAVMLRGRGGRRGGA